MTTVLADPWPQEAHRLIELQAGLGPWATEVRSSAPWQLGAATMFAGCFVAFGTPGPNGELAWAAAVLWRPGTVAVPPGLSPARRADRLLRGRCGTPRQAADVEAQVLVAGTVSAVYAPGLLALRQGPLLSEAIRRLPLAPDLLLVDATGVDHPRRAGLAVHLGAALDLPTVGVTHRALVAHGEFPAPVRGARSPLILDGEVVGYWVTTRTGARPVLAHAGWRTTPETAATVVLMASTEGARTPVPLQEARRVAREARSSS